MSWASATGDGHALALLKRVDPLIRSAMMNIRSRCMVFPVSAELNIPHATR
jgi:hypothetical protein